MNCLSDGLIDRKPVVPWREAGKIPWDDPAFSARMLREHLSQKHDRASRRFTVIDRHVGWLSRALLGDSPGRILDLGCGPGFYAARLAKLGHHCLGLDFSPASIEYAKSKADQETLDCEYRLADIRTTTFGDGFDLVLLTFGEFNTFSPNDALGILNRVRTALAPGGSLVLEVHTYDDVRSIGERSPTWFTSNQSVFSDDPHLCLTEHRWHAELRVSTERHIVVSCLTNETQSLVSTTQALADDDYDRLLKETGFVRVQRFASLTGEESREEGLFVLVATVAG